MRKGVTLGQTIVCYPFGERKRTLSLGRTQIDLFLKSGNEVLISPTKWVFPCLPGEEAHIKLEIDKMTGDFLMTALEGPLIKSSGFLMRSFMPQEGHIVDLGTNRIIFSGAKKKGNKSLGQKYIAQIGRPLILSDLPLLLEGATGTGKSHLANCFHRESGRAGYFIGLNLSSFPATLIESELFGHKKGSFTGAYRDRFGGIRQAEKGTLFLDEVDSLSLETQTKLLLFLDSKEYRPVGSEVSYKADVRFIFASGRPLEKLVEQGSFREDLFHRLSCGAKLELHSLASRPDLIKEGLDYFCETHSVSLEKRLESYYMEQLWPGNLRQLFGHLKRKSVIHPGGHLVWGSEDDELLKVLPFKERCSFDRVKVRTLEKVKEDYCYRTYLYNEKNLSQTARQLCISKNTLKKILRQRSATDDRIDMNVGNTTLYS
jgi:DNA-binding NtrC family response regulator